MGVTTSIGVLRFQYLGSVHSCSMQLKSSKKVFGLLIPVTEIADYMKTDVDYIYSQIREKILSGKIKARLIVPKKKK